MEKLVQALAKAQAAMKNAALNRTNPHFKSKYADLPAVRDAVIPFLAKEGIACVQTIERDEAGCVVKTSLLHGAARLDSLCPIMVAANAGAQQFGSALTYARRYSLAAIAGIAAEEDDDGNSAQDAPPKSQAPRPAQQQRNDPPPRQDKQPETPFDDAPQEQQQDKKAAFWSRASLQLRAEGPEAFATSFCNALYASPSHEQHMRLIRDNNNHIAALPAESEKRVNEAITKRAAFWSQHPTGVQRGAA